MTYILAYKTYKKLIPTRILYLVLNDLPSSQETPAVRLELDDKICNPHISILLQLIPCTKWPTNSLYLVLNDLPSSKETPAVRLELDDKICDPHISILLQLIPCT